VLILDEPTIGLDPNQIRHIRSLIRGLANRYTILLSSHILPEVESVCERVVIINDGHIVASDTTGNLLGLMKGNVHVSVEVQGPVEEVEARLAAIPGVTHVDVSQFGRWHQYHCECAKESDVRVGIYEAVRDGGWTLRELTTTRQNLEDVFVAMTAEGGTSL
jgi:ABC-2 type transport system ATP-binding protein